MNFSSSEAVPQSETQISKPQTLEPHKPCITPTIYRGSREDVSKLPNPEDCEAFVDVSYQVEMLGSSSKLVPHQTQCLHLTWTRRYVEQSPFLGLGPLFYLLFGVQVALKLHTCPGHAA